MARVDGCGAESEQSERGDGTGVVQHGFLPVYSANSRYLILGSFPSVRSRELGFYYAHPRNRFWPLMAALCAEAAPEAADVAGKRALILKHGFALYDAAFRVSIRASSDAELKLLEPADLTPIFAAARIACVLANGQKAYALSRQMNLACPLYSLPSTSPANARMSFEDLLAAWRAVFTVAGVFESSGKGGQAIKS